MPTPLLVAWVRFLEAQRHLQSLPRSALADGAEHVIADMFGGADGGTPAPALAEERPLSEADRKLFNIAVEKQHDGRSADALGTLSALVTRYPKNPMVRTFACNLALQTKASDALEQCSAAMEASARPTRGPRS